MKFIVQIGVLFLVLSMIPLVFKLLVKSRILPVLIWWGLGKELYPQWAAAHQLLFYGVLVVLSLLILASWLGPWLSQRAEDKRLERMIADEITNAHLTGRIIDGIQIEHGLPVVTYRD